MTNKELVNVVIPIYKEHITDLEKISLQQCIKVLSGYPITLICSNRLNLSTYFHEYPHFKVEYFDESYFYNIQSYNRLLLSIEFYNRLKYYEFILIYQLDAWVFRDELISWCKLGYDYIGAPWFKDFKSFEEGCSLWGVGNGGLSLRKVHKFIHILKYPGPVYRPGYIRYTINSWGTRNKIIFISYYIAKCLGYRNTIKYLLNINYKYEDVFWGFTLHHSWIKLNIAPIDVAMKFSFEKSPSFLFDLNNRQLPFGCHAWHKYEFQSFWKQYIR